MRAGSSARTPPCAAPKPCRPALPNPSSRFASTLPQTSGIGRFSAPAGQGQPVPGPPDPDWFGELAGLDRPALARREGRVDSTRKKKNRTCPLARTGPVSIRTNVRLASRAWLGRKVAFRLAAEVDHAVAVTDVDASFLFFGSFFVFAFGFFVFTFFGFAAAGAGGRLTAGRLAAATLTATATLTAAATLPTAATVTTAATRTTTAATAASATAIRTAAIATAVATAAAVATVTAVTGHHLVVLTANQGDADDRDENRDAQNQCTIHPRLLHKCRTGTVPCVAITTPSAKSNPPTCDGTSNGGGTSPVPGTRL